MEREDSLISFMSTKSTSTAVDSEDVTTLVDEDHQAAAVVFSVVGAQRAKPPRQPDRNEDNVIKDFHGTSLKVVQLDSSSFQQSPATFSLNKANLKVAGPRSFSFPFAKEIIEDPRWLTVDEAFELWDHAIYLHTNMSLQEACQVYFTILRCTSVEISGLVDRKKLWVNKGMTHLYREEAVEACSAFNRALKQDGCDPVCLFLYATARFDLGHYHESHNAFARCLAQMHSRPEMDMRPEGMHYTLLRVDADHNKELTARLKNAVAIDVGTESLKRMPTFMFYYPRPIATLPSSGHESHQCTSQTASQHSLRNQEETTFVSPWSPGSSEAGEEKQKSNKPTSKALNMAQTVSTAGPATTITVKSNDRKSKSTKGDGISPWKKLAADILFGKDDSPGRVGDYHGYSF